MWAQTASIAYTPSPTLATRTGRRLIQVRTELRLEKIRVEMDTRRKGMAGATPHSPLKQYH